MKVWFYCSYSGSPAGFQLGYVDTESLSESENDLIDLIAGTPHPLLNRCFSYQGVKEAFGKIPGTLSYVAVRPVSRCEGDRVYLNFAFETDDATEFASVVRYMDEYRERDRDLFNMMCPTVIEDVQDSSFGIHVNGRELQKVIQAMCQPSASEPWKGEFYVCTKDPGQGEELAENLRLAKIYRDAPPSVIPDTKRGTAWSVLGANGKIQQIPPKEDVLPPFVKAAVIMIALLALILIVMMFLKKQPTPEEETQPPEQSEVVQNPTPEQEIQFPESPEITATVTQERLSSALFCYRNSLNCPLWVENASPEHLASLKLL